VQEKLLCEKIRGKELVAENRRLERDAKKTHIVQKKYDSLNADYVRLMEAFEQSEEIREQQRLMLISLKDKLDGKGKRKGKVGSKKNSFVV
jgi:hypothetical protein